MDLLTKSKVIVASCNLNQWALDFDSNLTRIKDSIIQAKSYGARYRVGPELEISGYSCEDHFLELDTFIHSVESLASLLSSDVTDDILCDIGCPILHNNVRYNCRIFCLNRKIIMIRPKLYLADDGNYRERRYFTGWKISQGTQKYALPDILSQITGQMDVPIGYGILQTKETKIAVEVCEELWTPQSPHIDLFLSGVDIISNGSGSHHQLRKLESRLSLIQSATRKCGGVYIYSNHRGCDGTRLYFDGCSLISVNGNIVNQASQFSLLDVEVITAVIDLNDIRSYRNATNSLQEQMSSHLSIPIINIQYFSICSSMFSTSNSTSNCATGKTHILHNTPPIMPRIHTPEEECAYGPACWLWDYLRRSGACGYLLPLSGGADSASVATIVYVMCTMAVESATKGNKSVIRYIYKILGKTLPDIFPSSLLDDNTLTNNSSDLSSSILIPTSNELCAHVLNTIYMGTKNSSSATNTRAQNLANAIGAYHHAFCFDAIVDAVLLVFTSVVGVDKTPRYVSQGGSLSEDLALQNIQARLRMVMAYLCAQLFPWIRQKKGFLLVLGSANVDESLRGYMTKYDCSSADINPIGGICKTDLKKMMLWAADKYHVEVLRDIVHAVPTAELRPIDANEVNDYTQTDEEDMGMTYAELGIYGVLRKIHRCGPLTMFMKLMEQWHTQYTPQIIAEKVKRFFFYYSINRHKMTTLTPSYHAENYGTDDNRFDLRPFLYNVMWPRQFQCIDKLVHEMTEKVSNIE